MDQLARDVDMLRQVPLFAGIDAAKLKLLAFTSKLKEFEAGDILFREGEAADAAYVVMNGEATIFAHSPAGEIEIATLGPGEFLGEIGILCDTPRSATVRAATRLKTLRIGRECLTEMLDTFPVLSRTMLREIAGRLSRTSAELVRARAMEPHV